MHDQEDTEVAKTSEALSAVKVTDKDSSEGESDKTAALGESEVGKKQQREGSSSDDTCSTSSDDEELKKMVHPFELMNHEGNCHTYWKVDKKKGKVRFDKDLILSARKAVEEANVKKGKSPKKSPRTPKVKSKKTRSR